MRLTITGAMALAALAQAQDQVITGQTRIVTPNAPLGNAGGTTTIEQNALYWVSNGLIHAIQGSFDVYGQARVSNTDGTQTGMTSNYLRDVSNPNDAQVRVRTGGSFIVNDALSQSAPTFDWNINTLDNFGTMMWCSNGVGGGSTSLLFSLGNWHNLGVQAWSQTNPNVPNIQLSQASPSTPGQTPTANIINDGNMILTNITSFRVPQNIIGNGCWTIGRASNLDLSFLTYNKAPGNEGAWVGQAINLVGQDSGIRFGAATVDTAQILGMRIYGLGGSNGVGFQSQPTNIVYDPSGTLTFTIGGIAQTLSIGSGYTDGGFTTTLQNGYYMLQYPAGVPASTGSPPSTCNLVNELGDQCPTYERFVSTTSSSMASTTASSSQQTTTTTEIITSSTLETSTSQSSTSATESSSTESSSADSSTTTSSTIEISTSESSTSSSASESTSADDSTTASSTTVISTSEVSLTSSAAESTSATSSTTTSSSELTSESSSSSAAESTSAASSATTSSSESTSQDSSSSTTASTTTSPTEVTSTGSSILTTTTTLAPGLGNNTSTTIIVSTDMFTGLYTTVTSTGSVTEATTITQAPGPSDGTGTILVIVPSPSVIGPDTKLTSSASAVTSITQTSGRGNPTTTVVAVVSSSSASSFTGPYTTVTSVGTVTQATTTTLAPGPGGSIGTVIVTVPKQTSDPNIFTGPCKTVIETACVTHTLTLTQGPQPGKETGTAIVYVPGETKTFGGPCNTVTKTAGLTQGAITVTQAPKPGQQTGTVIVWVSTPTSAGGTKSTAPPVTVIKSPASVNATVGSNPHGGAATNPGQPGPSVVKASSASSLRGSFWMRCLAVLGRGLRMV